MKKSVIYTTIKGIFVLALMAILATGCSKNNDVKPAPSKTNAQLLIQSGNTTWTATAGTYYSGENATGTGTPATTEDLGARGSFALGAVTFAKDSLILSAYSYNGYGIITWSVTDTKPAELTVNFGTDDGVANEVEGVQILKAQIVSLDATKLVIIVNSKFLDNYQSYEETLTASSGIVTYTAPRLNILRH